MSPRTKRPFRLPEYRTYDASNGFGTPAEWDSSFRSTMGIEEALAAVGADSPFAILGVSRTADREAIRREYRKLARTCHPDLNPGDPGSAERFRRVQGAYEILSDPAARAAYERSTQ